MSMCCMSEQARETLPGARRGASHDRANAAMSRYVSGDAGAFSILHAVLAPKLRQYLMQRTRDAFRADDLVQETMLRIHLVRDRFTTGSDVFPWAFSIARRCLIDGIRRERREAARDRRLGARAPIKSPLSDDIVDCTRLARALQRELASLSAAQREAFELVKCDGLSMRDAAEALGTTRMAVRLRAHRASVALRDAFGRFALGLSFDE